MNDSNLQLIGGFDVFKVGDSHLRLVRLVRQLLHLLLDCVHPEADHGGHDDVDTDLKMNIKKVFFLSYFQYGSNMDCIHSDSDYNKTRRLHEVTEFSECCQD